MAGSYPAYLGKTVKKYGDVDVFVILTDRNLKYLPALWNLLSTVGEPSDTRGLYYTNIDNILSVSNFGSVQIIVKYHATGCLCDFHLNTEYWYGVV